MDYIYLEVVEFVVLTIEVDDILDRFEEVSTHIHTSHKDECLGSRVLLTLRLCEVVWRVDKVACDAIDNLGERCYRAFAIPLWLETLAIYIYCATTILLATEQIVGCCREGCLAEVASMSLAEGELCALGNLRALVVERNKGGICGIAILEREHLVAIVAIEHSNQLAIEVALILHISLHRSRRFAVCEGCRECAVATLWGYDTYETSGHTRCVGLERCLDQTTYSLHIRD